MVKMTTSLIKLIQSDNYSYKKYIFVTKMFISPLFTKF